MTTGRALGWLGIARLGLIQASLGAVVVLAISTVNRVMAVELELYAMIPGALVAWHYAVQILRPRMGYGSDQGGRRAPWIVGGQAVLAAGGLITALAIPLIVANKPLGIAVSFVGFTLVGVGAGTCGTTLLVLLAKRVEPALRPAAATIVWVMMIAGMAITAGVVSVLLHPYSHTRLIEVVGGVGGVAVVLTVLALWGIEGDPSANPAPPPEKRHQSFRAALAEVWAEPQARALTLFIFVSMLAYNAQELILEPFGGRVFTMKVEETARITGLQHGGAMLGMLATGVLCTVLGRRSPAAMRAWTVGGCLGSGLMLLLLAYAGLTAPGGALADPTAAGPLAALATPKTILFVMVFVLGVANGVFAVSAISAMMAMVGQGARAREGTRMGIWGAAQAVAFAAGGLLATAASDAARALLGSPSAAYAAVFALEAVLFAAAAWLAVGVFRLNQGSREGVGSDQADGAAVAINRG